MILSVDVEVSFNILLGVEDILFILTYSKGDRFCTVLQVV